MESATTSTRRGIRSRLRPRARPSTYGPLVVQARAPQRGRQARSIANDAAILDAAVRLLDRAGWEGSSVLRLAEESGLSRPPILERYGDRTGVVIAAWRERLAPVMRAALAELVGTIDARGGSTDPDAFASALRAFFDPGESMRAAIEVILVARYVEALDAAVRECIATDLDSWITPHAGRPTRAQAARHAAAISLALGLLIEARTGHPILTEEISDDVSTFAAALNAHATPVKLPATRAMHLAAPPDFGSDDPALAALLTATLEEISTYGYEASTVQRIGRASGHTKGLIFARYGSKLDLVTDATDRMLALAAEANGAFLVELASQYSPGIADATMTREFMRPELAEVRTVTTEQYRLAWHHERMHAKFEALQDAVTAANQAEFPSRSEAQARGLTAMGLARAIGMGVLADLHPTAWQLPHDVVSVPLIDGQ